MAERLLASHREESAERDPSVKPPARGLARAARVCLGLAPSSRKPPFPHRETRLTAAPAAEEGGLRQAELRAAAGTGRVPAKRRLTFTGGLLRARRCSGFFYPGLMAFSSPEVIPTVIPTFQGRQETIKCRSCAGGVGVQSFHGNPQPRVQSFPRADTGPLFGPPWVPGAQ